MSAEIESRILDKQLILLRRDDFEWRDGEAYLEIDNGLRLLHVSNAAAVLERFSDDDIGFLSNTKCWHWRRQGLLPKGGAS